jgi:hypothetical protein
VNQATIHPSTWGAYAACVYEVEQRKGRRIHDRRRFEDAVAADGMRRLSEQAELWHAMFVVTPRRLAEALADGHPPRYAERRVA